MAKSSHSQFVSFLSLFWAALFFASSVCADDKASMLDEIKWHGFLSQSFILTDENNYLGSSSDGSFKFNSAGLNASWKPNRRLQFSLQGLYKQIGNAKPKGTQLDYAIMDLTLADEFDHGGGLRFGRLKNPFGFFNETRDVAVTRPSLLLAESIYIDYLQALFHSMDSMGIYYRKESDQGTYSFDSTWGKPILTNDIVKTLMGGIPVSGDIGSERASMSRLMYEDASGKWRSAMSYISFRGDYRAGPTDFMLGVVDGKLDIKQLMLSFEYNIGDFQIITEALRRNISIRDSFTLPVPVNVYDQSLGYYLQFGYRVNEKLKTYIRRDEVFYDKDDRNGTTYGQFRGNSHTAYAKDFTIGLSYTPSFAWNFSMEAHVVNGTYWLPNLENPDVQNQKQHWNMFLAQVAYRF
jgi:hypothetical protein